MLSRLFVRQRPATMMRCFSSVSTVDPSAIKNMRAREVGDVLGSFAKEESTLDAAKAQALSENIDEFFRVNFRKIEFEDAKYIAGQLAKDGSKKINALDDKFWIWETLEEEIRPNADKLTGNDCEAVFGGFLLNIKGSEDLIDILTERLYAQHITSPF